MTDSAREQGMARVVVVGSANTDLVCQVVRLPAAGETVLGGCFFTAAGGKGANQAVAAARLGAEVTFIACLGADEYGRAALAGYQAAGIETTQITLQEKEPSGVALILVSQDGENQIAVAPGANSLLTAAKVRDAADAFVDAAVVLLQLEVPLEAVQTAAELGRAAGALVILNPAPMPPGGLPPELLAAVDIITPNEREAAALAAAEGPEQVTALRRLGPAVVVTRGARGALAVTADGSDEVPAPRVTAVDTVGAGDAFNAALGVALAEGHGLHAAVVRACAAGALAATRPGAQPALPSRAELETFLAGA